MARRAPQTTLSPQMLKHFAVATVIITACLALFADGEGRNEFGLAAAARERNAAAAVAAAGNKVKPKFALNTKIRDARRTYVPLAGEDGESGAAYGAPMDSAAGSAGGSGGSSSSSFGGGRGTSGGPNSRAAAQVAVQVQPRDASDPSGPSRRPPAAAPHRPSPAELDQLEQLSRQRSGAEPE